jgi:hypothetical protein
MGKWAKGAWDWEGLGIWHLEPWKGEQRRTSKREREVTI